jgi:hypothetical protein
VIEAMVMRIVLHIPVVHPLLAHEVHRLAAGAVRRAVVRPIALVHFRHVQVDRTLLHGDRRRGDDHRLRVDHGRGHVSDADLRAADVDAPIDARHVDVDAGADGHLGLGSAAGEGHEGDGGELEVDLLHDVGSFNVGSGGSSACCSHLSGC